MNGSEGPVMNRERRKRFREASSAMGSRRDAHVECAARKSISVAANAAAGYGRATSLLVGIWLVHSQRSRRKRADMAAQ